MQQPQPPSAAPSPAPGEWRFRLILLFASCLLSFAAGEIGLRVLGVGAPAGEDEGGGGLTFFTHDPELGWDLVPGTRDAFATPEFDTEIAITSEGLRAPRVFGPATPPGVRRVVVLGDSFTFGHGVEVDQAWPALLDDAREDLEIVNLAVTGYGTDQQLLRFERRLEDFQPDAVILGLFVGNIFRNARFEQLGYSKPRFDLRDGRLELVGVPVPEGRPLRGGSRLLGVLGRGSRTVLEHLGYGEAWPVSAAILDRLAARCAERGAPLFVMILPKDQLIYGSGPRRGLHERTLEVTREMLAESQLPFLDLTPALRQGAQRGGERLYYPVDGHWSAAGHAVAAAALGRWLEERIPAAREEAAEPP
ncbi:MAG: GDSL-type esterase/lipase family protein [Acidobacteriota bacterium]